MSTPNPDPAAKDQDSDEELVLTFLTHYQALEQALLRAGFIRAGRTPGSSQADWVRFARHIEKRFNPKSSEALHTAVTHLLWEDKNMDLRNERLERYSPLEQSDPQHDIVWIAELLQHTRNKLAYGLNFPQGPGCDTSQILAALFVVEDWSHIDPEVERLLGYVQ